MANPIMLNIEVVFAQSAQQVLIAMQVSPGTSIKGAIQQSGILTQFPNIDLPNYKIGVFSKIVALEALVHDGDRIEIYQPLLIDPKNSRKQRAKRQAQLKSK